MLGKRRVFLGVLAVAFIVAAAVLPLPVLGDGFSRDKGSMFVPAGSQEPMTLTVSGISVTVPVGSMPKGGKVMLFVTENSEGWFMAEFLPSQKFDVPVIMDFGTVRDEVVFYHEGAKLVPLKTSGGKLFSPHFSRYSGWH